jgi:hypothetical protein
MGETAQSQLALTTMRRTPDRRHSGHTSPPRVAPEKEPKMPESIPRNDGRDTAFCGITAALSTHGFTKASSPEAAPSSSPAGHAARIAKVMEDLMAAECWEFMTLRSAARPQTDPRKDQR